MARAGVWIGSAMLVAAASVAACGSNGPTFVVDESDGSPLDGGTTFEETGADTLDSAVDAAGEGGDADAGVLPETGGETDGEADVAADGPVEDASEAAAQGPGDAAPETGTQGPGDAASETGTQGPGDAAGDAGPESGIDAGVDAGTVPDASAASQPPTCNDGVRNGQETSTDCGGPTCSPCGTGAACNTKADCASTDCVTHVCAAANCVDGIKNGDETGVDCGGTCPAACSNGGGCAGPSDCASGQCVHGSCTAPACNALGLPGLPAVAPGSGDVALVDMDGDGKLDAVTAGPVVFLNTGGGVLVPGTSYGSTGGYVVTGDLDGNGTPDLVITSTKLTVMLNQGGGTFATSVTNAGAITRSVLADVDGDGKLDIVFGSQNDTTGAYDASVLFNLGSGTFGGRVDLPVTYKVLAVGAADMNGDGKPDLVAGMSNTSTSDVAVYINQGGRAFAPGANYPVDIVPESLAIADFDGDGKPDVASLGGSLAVLLNAGGGVLSAGADYYVGGSPGLSPDSNFAYTVTAADVDGDGKTDLAITSPVAVSVLRNVGGGAFGANTDYAASGPYAVKLGDMDGDGRLDMVVACQSGLTTMLNRGGSFASEVEYQLGPAFDTVHTAAAESVVRLADVDGDGRLDFVSVEGDGAVAVRRQTAGGFGPRVTYATPNRAHYLQMADLDGDGRPEIVVGTDEGAVSVLPNLGDGTFGPREDFVVGSSQAPVVVGDFDGDGQPDIAAGDCTSGNVRTLTNLGALRFAAGPRYPAGTCPLALAAGDLDGDGVLDLAVANFGGTKTNGASVLLGTGKGAFALPVTYANGEETVDVAVADLNGDGKLDVATADFLSGTVSVFLNQGQGALGPSTPFSAPSNPVSIAIADLDHDGKPDIVSADVYDTETVVGDLGVFHNVGGGSFAKAVALDLGSTGGASVTVGDVNGDGNPDLGVAYVLGVGFRLGHGNLAFDETTYLEFDSQGPDAITTADLDGDGKPDLITGGGVSMNAALISILFNQGGGSFGDRVAFPTRYTPMQIVVADVDGDGLRDLVAAEKLTVSSGNADGTVSVYLNRGDGSFDAADYSIGLQAAGLAVADLNGDGRPDVAAVDDYDNQLSVLLNQGQGKLSTPTNYTTPDPVAIAIGDLDGNGTPDLAVLNAMDGTVSVTTTLPGKKVSLYFNRGDGSFTAGPTLPTSGQAGSLALADLDGDGVLDIVALSSNTTSVFLGQGGGHFAARVDYATTFSGLALAVADLDGDGLPDLAIDDEQDSVIEVSRNLGKGTFGSYAQYPTGFEPRSMSAADLSGDGRIDLAVAGDGDVSVLLNTCW